jgi:hypothetical protein
MITTALTEMFALELSSVERAGAGMQRLPAASNCM